MLIKRRIRRVCASADCNEFLVKRSDETTANFLKRATCNTTCAGAYRKQKTQENSVGSLCFCGKPTENDSPFCCWDHRLIANRCKQWRIPISITDYEAYANRLEEEQRLIDRYFLG
jgi:hypothetical protein